MEPRQLIKQFAAIGAQLDARHVARLSGEYDLDVQGQGKQEHYLLRYTREAPEMRVLQANKLNRHLLLHAPGRDGGERFLCGHDERHWFVAAIAERVSTVTEAKRALLPKALRDVGIDADTIARRHNDVFKRQGEWFFVPATKDLSGRYVHHQEPIMRNRRSKPHICAELIRLGGLPVVLLGSKEYTMTEWDALIASTPPAERGRLSSARRMMKDAEVYVRGAVRHADHATLILPDWHRVHANVEAWTDSVSFYD